MYHYTYLIQHKNSTKRYIGVRSSKVPAKEDINYWGSSKYLPDDVKETHRKIIIKEFKTRKEAVLHEILLHELNNVGINSDYYNKSKQTSTKFDTSGIKLTEEHKAKCSKALKGRHVSEETKRKISKAKTGVKKSPELRKIFSEAQKASKLNKKVLNSNFRPWYISEESVTHLFYDITKVDKAIQDGLHPKQYTSLAAQCRKSGKPIAKGVHKGLFIADIPKLHEDIV